MSWSLELIRTKTNTEPYDDEKEEDVIPFMKSEILDCINDIHEIINISIEDAESDFVHVYGEKWRVEICFWKECLYSEKDMTYYTIELQIRGGTEPKEFLSLFTEKLRARLFDMHAGIFWTCNGSGFSEWKNLCDRIVKELFDEKGKNK